MPPVEELATDLWSIPVPIPNNPLRYVSSYVFASGGGLVLLDSGWHAEESWQALTGGHRLLGRAGPLRPGVRQAPRGPFRAGPEPRALISSPPKPGAIEALGVAAPPPASLNGSSAVVLICSSTVGASSDNVSVFSSVGSIGVSPTSKFSTSGTVVSTSAESKAGASPSLLGAT